MSKDADVVALAAAVEAERCKRSFRYFLEKAWPYMDPGSTFKTGIPVDALCTHLQAVAEGKLNRLAIAVPPGSAKSLVCSVAYLPWVWLSNPTYQAIHASYSFDLATRDSRRARHLVESDWYQAMITRDGKPAWVLETDGNRAHDWSNTKGGRRLCAGVEGKLTGERGKVVIIDDALSVADAHSKNARDTVARWFSHTVSSRLHNLATDAFVVIGQRTHESDLTGYLLESGGWQYLCLPSEYVASKPTRTHTVDGTLFWEDPRKIDGELLFEALFSRKVLDQARKDLGSAGYSAQHQQNPVVEGGNVFQRRWWRWWKPDGTAEGCRRPDGANSDPARALPTKFDLIASIDCAFKGTETSDWVVIQVWAAHGADRYLIDQSRGRWDFPATLAQIRSLARKHPRCRKWLIEDKANGSAVISSLQTSMSGIIAINPEGGKEARAAGVSPQVESGNVYLPEGVGFVDEFIDECAAFPRGKHDDQCDSMTQVLNYLANPDAMRLRRLLSNL